MCRTLQARRLLVLIIALVAAAPLSALAQPASAERVQPAPVPPPPPSRLRRWVDLQAASFALRYRFAENSAGVTTANHAQHREQIRARFKLDPRGRYAVHAGVFSGGTFTASWNLTGLGTGDANGALFLKQLFASAVPIRGFEIQLGGLYVTRGESTEITSYDEDGFILGERAIVSRAEEFWFDEVSVTQAYLGDGSVPNVFRRMKHIEDPDYRQVQFVKRTPAGVHVSFDVTTAAGAETLRAAATVRRRATLGLDVVRLELYRRVTRNPAGGFAITVERAVARPLRLTGGYADIDPRYGGLNADRFNHGRRFYGIGTWTITPALSLQLFATRALADDFPVSLRTRLDVVVTYNALPALARARLRACCSTAPLNSGSLTTGGSDAVAR